MGTIPVTDPHKAWNVKQFKRLEAYNARLQKLLDNAIKKAAAIAMRHDAKASDEHLFSFSDDRQMKAEADKLMKDLSDEITSFTKSAIGKEWEKALQQATEYIGMIYSLAKQTQERQDAYLDMMLVMRSRNEDALIEFNKRKIGGLNLSKKVWSYTQDFERQLEVSIDTALMQGMSANNLALSIQSLLKDPDDLFRRVRDENDQLRMSKAMEAYHPGTGKYRSAYKNAMRLARSEINMAYRSSDCNVAMMSDCCVGIEIHLSNNQNCKGVPKGEFYDICDQLAGKYPKDFQWTGWHPQCRCFMTYVLKTDDEFWTDLENGENNESVNTVKDVPDNFKEWVKENEGRIEAAERKGTAPYFISDNKATVDGILGKKQSAKVEDTIVGRDAAGNPITHGQWYGTPPAGKKPTENAARIEEYRRYKEDPDYRDVEYNQETGGLKATHVGHKTHENDMKTYFDEHLTGDQLEMEFMDKAFALGHSVIFRKEAENTVDLDMILDGEIMDLISVTGNSAHYRNQLNRKNAQLKKYNVLHDDSNHSVCIYFHDSSYYSYEKIKDGMNLLRGLTDVQIRTVYILKNDGTDMIRLDFP